jgi:hypothetical protein
MVSNSIDIFISNGKKKHNYSFISRLETNCLMNTPVYAFNHSQTATVTLSTLHKNNQPFETSEIINNSFMPTLIAQKNYYP